MSWWMIVLTPPPIALLFYTHPHSFCLFIYFSRAAWDQRGEVMNGTESHTGQDQHLDCVCVCVCVVLLSLQDSVSDLSSTEIFAKWCNFGQSALLPEASLCLVNWGLSLRTRLEQAVTTRSQMLKPVWKLIKIQFLKRLQEKSHCTDVSGKDPNFSLKMQSPKQLVVFLVYLLSTCCWENILKSVLLRTELSHRII